MTKVLKKTHLNDTVAKMVLEAPLIAKKAEPGQFIIIRAKADSERIYVVAKERGKQIV